MKKTGTTLRRMRTFGDKKKDFEIRNYIEALKDTEEYSIYGETTCIPADSLSRKFTYFYKPYNFNINSKIYMTYPETEQSEQEKLLYLEDYVKLKQKQNEKALLNTTFSDKRNSH